MVETLTLTLTRRTLNFPAIQPSDEVSLNTLLNSLIELAAEICGFRSKFFASNERNARESTRLIGVFLVFLEELREWLSHSSEDELSLVLLSLSELHVAFQKLRCLLEDCSRDGARVWMLVKSEIVAGEFRSLVRSVSTAMDVFPMDRIDSLVGGFELREHVELAMKQARNSKFGLDSNDQEILQIVHSVLFGFENGVIPNRSEVIQVLNYLGIKSWTKCHEEAKFLDSEMEFETQKRKETTTETTLLSSLTGFVCYCRCTAFDKISGDEQHRYRFNSPIGINEDDLRCPISLEIMSDPVTIASGHTYDRVSISKWFASGNFTCPKTGEKLPSTEFVPNPSLQRLIQIHCHENGIELLPQKTRRGKKEVFPVSLAAESAARLAGEFLAVALETGSVTQRNRAAFEVRTLSKSSGPNRARLVESGVVAPLLRLSLSSPDSAAQENPAAALLNLSKLVGAREVIFRHGGSEAMVELLRKSSEATRQHAAGVLFYLASSSDDRRASIGSNPEVFPNLIGLIRDGTDRGKKNALVAVLALLAHQGNRWRALSAGIVPLLVNLLLSLESSDELVADSLAILSLLAEDFDGASEILCHGVLDLTIEILNSSESRSAKEQSVSLLLSLSKNRERDVVSQLVKRHSLMGTLYLLVSQGTSRSAGKKASALIRVLQEFSERRSSSLLAPILSQDRVIRAW